MQSCQLLRSVDPQVRFVTLMTICDCHLSRKCTYVASDMNITCSLGIKLKVSSCCTICECSVSPYCSISLACLSPVICHRRPRPICQSRALLTVGPLQLLLESPKPIKGHAKIRVSAGRRPAAVVPASARPLAVCPVCLCGCAGVRVCACVCACTTRARMHPSRPARAVPFEPWS